MSDCRIKSNVYRSSLSCPTEPTSINKLPLFFCARLLQAVTGNFVENLNSNNVNMLNNNKTLCDNEIVDIDEQNENENNQLENELRRGSSSNMLVSQSFYSKERFKVLLGEYFSVCVLFFSFSSTLITSSLAAYGFTCSTQSSSYSLTVKIKILGTVKGVKNKILFLIWSHA